MKKLFFYCLLSLFTIKGMAQQQPTLLPGERICFCVMYPGIPTPIGGHTPVPRNPTPDPEVSIDGYTLYTQNLTFDADLVIIDQEGEEVFTAHVTVGTPSVILPSTLEGEYEIQLIPTSGDYYFYGYVMF